MNLYVVTPKIPCLVLFGCCIFIHLAIFIYGCINLVWYIMAFTFIMCILYSFAIAFTVLNMQRCSTVVVALEVFMLFLQFVVFILIIIIVAGKPVEGIDIVYEVFPPGENFIPTYTTLAWALLICMFLLLFINLLGLLATLYNVSYYKYYEEDQIVIRG
ncbi:unnamed protein product [Bursaphelenchus okinawaensis]|uniref:Uncharacterized protein n=1 Tax=Bursaphelenchus okinawaensis TaxID=465554 RepID=A0A811LI93_9BILA|nr:unnamed protein product [Bursaphelenchus okinawaensis]CAG9123127.1 unnamed protein product [Bursaphelenchus okinawaensis]